MKLRTYLEINKISGRQFGRLLQTNSSSMVSDFVNGKRTPRPQIMLRIFKVTKGAVTPYDFLNIPNDNYRGLFAENKAKITVLSYEEKLKVINELYVKYKKSVKQKNIADIISNNGERLSVMSVSERLSGKVKFTEFELEQLFNFYFTKESKNIEV